MELKINSEIFIMKEDSVKINYTLDDGQQIYNIVEIVPLEMIKKKEILNRLFDKMTYEMRCMLKKRGLICNDG